jgi:hypothetical protein
MDTRVRFLRRGAPGEDVNDRWARLIEDDGAGIDGDIERLIGLSRMKYGYTRKQASAELVKRLSSLARPGLALSEVSCCS